MQSSNIKHSKNGVEILVRGTVQGVGFRPFIYNLASRLDVSGTVTNTSEGVIITAAASDETLKLFLQAITEQAPPLAKITTIEAKPVEAAVAADSSFSILPSVAGAASDAAIPPDISVCDDCLRELTDPFDRRLHYPFTNCTNCGPRFSIVTTIPYDRPQTSMRFFPMCEMCSREYHDPADRRFHAQPNACPQCGPAVSLFDRDGHLLDSPNPIADTARALSSGKIVAIKGLGGFHLATDASSEAAVTLLRLRKGRPDKPLAVMVGESSDIEDHCLLTDAELQLLTSPEHPIVLLQKKRRIQLADNVAPGIDKLGMMLAYTPLHHVLFQQPDCPRALVMTSGNRSGAPICIDNLEAVEVLSSICDIFLMHNRGIVTRVDDSVVNVSSNGPLIFRRARGYAPTPIEIAWKIPPTLGCGGGLKSTFSLGRRQSICTSQHIGDLDNVESLEFYQESVEHLKALLQLEPEIAVCDLHPDYLSSQYAAKLGLPLYKVQHHHAHAVAVMAEHGLQEPVLALVLDGTGLGEDQTIWGGEILYTDLTSYKRMGHLSHLRLPGGDMVTKEIWRMGVSAIFDSFGENGLKSQVLPRPLRNLEPQGLTVITSMLTNGFNSPVSSSCGRLFDAIASILGVRQITSYEGQAAMELECLAKSCLVDSWRQDAAAHLLTADRVYAMEKDSMWQIDCRSLIQMVIEGLHRGVPEQRLAADFHIALIESLASVTKNIAGQTGVQKVVLAGGCLQNSILLEGLTYVFKHLGLQVFTGKSLPINDGAISFGQAVIGGLLHVSRNSNESN